MPTIFVTGSSGFIAKHIVLKALNAGHTVTGSLRTPARADEVRTAVAPHLTDKAALDRLSFATLDLTRDDGWDGALRGHDALIHTASPFPIVQPKDPETLIGPARDGTLRALKAAKAAGIDRVVLTSSSVAILGGVPDGRVATEADWTDPDAPGTLAYERSKTIAERAAWDFAEANGMALTTINPAFVVGPPLDRHFGSSVGVVARILRGRDPMVPKIGFPLVDVRDVAEMHVRAVEDPATAGSRFISCCGSLWMDEWTRILKAAYPQRRIPTRVAPAIAIRFLGLFDREMRVAAESLGRMPLLSSEQAHVRMGIDFIPPDVAIRDTAAALIALGVA